MSLPTTFLESTARDWHIDVRVAGFGPYLGPGPYASAQNDARYRWCAKKPNYAANQIGEVWVPHLRELPDLIKERIDPSMGGVPKVGGITFPVADHRALVASWLQPSARPIGELAVDLNATDLTFTAVSSGQANAMLLKRVHIGTEAFAVDSVAGAVCTCRRAYAGTTAVPHYVNDKIYLQPHYLTGLSVEVYAAPQNGTAAGEQRLAVYSLQDLAPSPDHWRIWEFMGGSGLRVFDRQIPTSPRRGTITHVAEAQGLVFVDATSQLQKWDHWGDDRYFVQIGRELAKARVAGSGALYLEDRELLGSPRDDLKPGTVVREVFLAGESFRVDEAAGGGFPGTGTEYVKTDHMVDLMLGVITSPSTYGLLAQGGNGGRSILPSESGYGAGIELAKLNLDSFESFKARNPEYRFPNFVLGEDKPMSLAEFLTRHFLLPMGARLVEDAEGRIKLVENRLPLLGETIETITASEVQRRPDGRPALAPAVGNGRELTGITFEVGRHAREITFYPSDFFEIFGLRDVRPPTPNHPKISVPGGSPALREIYGSVALGYLWRSFRKQTWVRASIDLGTAANLVSGDYVSFTAPGVHNLENGGRGYTNALAEVVDRELKIRSAPWHGQVNLRVYGEGIKIGRWAPAAWVTSVATNTATCQANRYTAADAPAGLPATDVAAFAVGQTVKLINGVGTSASGLTQVVVSIATPDITLDGDFGGALTGNTVITLANFDDDPAQDDTAYAADKSERTVDASSTTPYLWGE